jgi:flagellar biosynthesis/type III secretory pathway protein FliH
LVEEKPKMREVSSFEHMVVEYFQGKGFRQGFQQGFERGFQLGLQQGLQQGSLNKSREDVVKVLRARFKRVPKLLLKKIDRLQDTEKLSQLLEDAVLANSLSEFKPHLD